MKTKYSFREARRITRKHGFHTEQEFLDYDCPGAYGVQKDVANMYSDEWRGWDDFLGVPPSFQEGKAYLKGQGLSSIDAYMTFLKANGENEDSISSRFHCKPDKFYKEGWQGWNDWLGIG